MWLSIQASEALAGFKEPGLKDVRPDVFKFLVGDKKGQRRLCQHFPPLGIWSFEQAQGLRLEGARLMPGIHEDAKLLMTSGIIALLFHFFFFVCFSIYVQRALVEDNQRSLGLLGL